MRVTAEGGGPVRGRLLVLFPALMAAGGLVWGQDSTALQAEVERYAAAACLNRQEQPFLQEQGHRWAAGILERAGGSLDHWRGLGDAVAAPDVEPAQDLHECRGIAP